jgi:hypothetical protein
MSKKVLSLVVTLLLAAVGLLHAVVSPAGDADTLAALDLDATGMQKVKAAAQTGNLDAVMTAYLDYRRTLSPAKWKVMPADRPATSTASSDPVGDAICAHRIPNLFYAGLPKEADMGTDFNWTYNPTPKGDPSFTLEWTWCVVSRTQFWSPLVDAYWKTHNEKYAAEWVRQMEDFVAKNPVDKAGTAWNLTLWRTLDAAIRMLESWPNAYYHCLNSPSFTPQAQWIYLKSMRDHAAFLMAGLGDPKRTGNWVTEECCGLYTIGTLFPELKDASVWRKTAIDRLIKEAQRLVLPDGMEAELTPTYHLLALSGFRQPLELAKLNGQVVPDEFKEKVMSMYRALVTVMAQNGEVVPTNDSTYNVNAITEARKGLELGEDPLLRWAASGEKGEGGLPDSTMLPYAGFYAMRSGWDRDDQFLFFRAGPTGIAHAHEDMLEVVLRAWGKTLLFDPGSYVYDHSDWRRFTINTPSHSTVIVDGKWQHRGESPAPIDKPAGNLWVTTPLFDFVSGTYDGGYQQNVYDPKLQGAPQQWVGDVDRSVTHTRQVLYLRPYYALLFDTLAGTGKHVFDAHFQLDATSAHVDAPSQAAFSDDPGGARLGLYPLERENLAVDVVQGQKDPLLGWYPSAHRAIPTVRFRKQQDAPAFFATFLYPFKEAAPTLEAKPLNVQGDLVWAQTVTTPRETLEIALSKSGAATPIAFTSSSVGAVKANASGVVVRSPLSASGGDAWVGTWQASNFEDGSLHFTMGRPANLVIGIHQGCPILFNGADRMEAPLNIELTKPFAASVSLRPRVWTEISAHGSREVGTPSLFTQP